MASEEETPELVETPGRNTSVSESTPVAATSADLSKHDSGGCEKTLPFSAAPKPPAAKDEPRKGSSKEHWFKAVERVASFLANITVLVGIAFALYQIKQAEILERRRVAIEAIRETRSAEFLKAFRMAKTAYHSKQVKEEDKVALLDSLNHVMNVYDNIAIMYLSGVADKCIIKGSIQSGAREMSRVSGFLAYPPEYRANFDSLLTQMESEECGGKMPLPSQP